MSQVEDKILSLLGEVNEIQVETLIDLVNRQLINRLKVYKKDISEIPAELEYIVVETVIARFNYLGSEGMKAESVEGHTMTFDENYLNRFDDDIELWAEANGYIDNGKGKVVFL